MRGFDCLLVTSLSPVTIRDFLRQFMLQNQFLYVFGYSLPHGGNDFWRYRFRTYATEVTRYAYKLIYQNMESFLDQEERIL